MTVVFLLITFPVYAADSTPSANVQSKLEALKQEIASKAAKLKAEVSKKLTNKAYIGVVKQKSKTSITIATKTTTKIVSINQDTTYVDTRPTKKGVREVTGLEGIKEEMDLAALGDVDDTGVLNARRIVILPPAAGSGPKTYIWGQIVSITDDLITLKLKNGKNVAIAENEDPKTSSKLKTNQTVIVSGIIGKNDILEASLIHIISQLSSTPTATKSASPSATPKKK